MVVSNENITPIEIEVGSYTLRLVDSTLVFFKNGVNLLQNMDLSDLNHEQQMATLKLAAVKLSEKENPTGEVEPKGVLISKKSWYVEITGMTIKRAKNSPLIQKIMKAWTEHYVAPTASNELHIRENGSRGKVYVFVFDTPKKMREFNTAVFWGNGYK